METKNKKTLKVLSTDLSGFEKYLCKLGMSERQIEFLKLAPRRLIELFGCFSGLELLKDCEFKAKFMSYIKDRYKPGQLKKYASGISHYREYLVSIKTLIPYSDQVMKFTRRKKSDLRVRYEFKRSNYYKDIENKYIKHLRIELEYCKAEYRKKLRAFQKFALFLIEKGTDSFADVRAMDVINFSKLETTYKTDWNSLKGFLNFAFRQGYTTERLAEAIITVKYKTRRKKQYLKSSEIERILNSICRTTITGKRTFAIFLLMARLGLRPSEPLKMKLNDVDWVNARVFVRGKNKRNAWLPMPQDVADAIMDYLKSASRGDSEKLFVQLRPPFDGFERTYVFSKALCKAYQQTGICPPTGNVRLNVFRHSFATKLINEDNLSVFAVQSILRHSTPSMTLHYAKYHSKKLRVFEVKWPGAAS